MKKQNEENPLGRQYCFRTVLFVLLSAMEYVTIETFLGGDYAQIGWEYSSKNIMILSGINLILVSVLRSLRNTYLISGVFVLVLGVANYFVDAFRGYGIVYMDFYAIRTAMNVVGEYHFHWDRPLVLGMLVGAAQLVFCAVVLPKGGENENRRMKESVRPEKQEGASHPQSESAKKGFWQRRIVRRLATSGLGMVAGIGFFFYINSGYSFWSDVNNLTWDHSIGIAKYGYLLYATANAGEAKVTPPKGYSARRADEILSRYRNPGQVNSVLATHVKKVKSPHLIMIMNESFSDLSVLGKLPTDKPYLSFFNSLSKNTIRGYVESSVYGGYTANSEFEFLSGCSKAFVPGNPFLQYLDDAFPNIISNIKAQEGYEKAIAIHPYNPSGYNRNRVYPLLSLDEFLSQKDFQNPVMVRDYVSDESDYDKLIKLYEDREPGKRVCFFNVTMQNHSAYDNTKYHFQDPVQLKGQLRVPEAEQYLSLMRLSDQAFEKLIRYFQKESEPVMIVLFGDHQPHLPDYFYQKVMGEMPDAMSAEETMKRYQVPFMIWTNYDIREDEIGRTSINYLSTIMSEAAGLKLTDFQKFLMDLYQRIPSISANGYYDNRDQFYSWDESPGIGQEKTEHEKELEKWIEEYRIVEYNYIFDKENRRESHYQLEGRGGA